MTPGEIHGLHKQVVDDLKAQLAAAREDASNERTRAEAAEQELRDDCKRTQRFQMAQLPSGWWTVRQGASWCQLPHWPCCDEATIRECTFEAEWRDKFVREVAQFGAELMTADEVLRACGAKLARIRAHLKGVDLSDLSSVPMRALIAAAREALEP